MNFTNATKQVIKALEPKIVYHPRNFYVAQMDIGTTPYSALLVVDTGFETTWVQEFVKITCVYEINYKDHSHSRGYLSSDTFTFPAHGGERVSYENVVFGVGLDNQNIAFSKFRESENTIAGVLGLGRGYRSILWQLKLRLTYVVSHIAFLIGPIQDTHTYLHFGRDAQIRGTNQEIVKTTPLIPNVNMYYVEVLSISMEGKKLPIDPVEFQLRSDFKGGFAIDTGSALTYLVQNAYNIVRVEIVKYLHAYNWNPTVHSELPYDLCYDVIPTENQ
nr:aspartic proteinase nepenthesin-1-like [Quercus suber]